MGFGRHLCVWACVGLICLPGSVGADFTEVSASAGLDIDEIKNGGLTWADLDGDGDLDVVVNTSGNGFVMFNQGGSPPTFVDMTAELAPHMQSENAERCIVAADLSHDGYPDLVRTDEDLIEVLLNRGPTSMPPFRFGLDGGSPDFSLHVASDPQLDPEGCAVLDYDGDGWLDIVYDNGGELRVLRNPADQTADFLAVGPDTVGLPTLADVGMGDGDYLTVVDFDLDGYVDIHARNTVGGLADLYRNVGDGTFVAIDMPDLDSAGGGGIDYCDFDNDGDFDFFYSSGVGPGVNRVWLQETPREFVDSGAPDVMSTTVDGVACGDVDNDGDADLYLSRGDDDELWINQLAESGSLGWTLDNRGITASGSGEGVVMVDYDMDGDLDVYVNQTGPRVTDPMTMMTMGTPARNRLWRNDLPPTGYLAVQVLAEVRTCPDVPVRRTDTGAVVRISHPASGWESGVQSINGGKGHGSQGSPILHFGVPMGIASEYEVTVRFQHGDEPDAAVRVTPSDLGAYQLLTVVASDPDGDGIPTTLEMAAVGDDSPDPDLDGLVAWHDVDADGDGVSDEVEAGDRVFCTPPVDSDGDGIADFLAGSSTPGEGGFPPGARGLEAHGSGLLCSASPRRGAATWWSWALVPLLLGLRRGR